MPKCMCKQEMVEKTVETYQWLDKYMGELQIHNAIFFTCAKCDGEVMPFETAIKIEEEEKRVRQEWLWSHSDSAEDFNNKFITSSETAAILGLSGRQAIHKNLQYKGLIYHMNLKGNVYFLKKSVQLFKETGDGRLMIEEYVLQTASENEKPPPPFDPNNPSFKMVGMENSNNESEYDDELKEN